MMNNGLTASEIAERLTLPEVLARRWFLRGNYGTTSHNAKAIYQRYLGWYDGNPAHLNPLPPEEANRRYVDAMGGENAVLKKSKEAFDNGDYRWSSELLSRLCSPLPLTRRHACCLRTALNSSATSLKAGHGGTHILMAPKS